MSHNRRVFIKQSALWAGATLLEPRTPGVPAKKRVALVGTGIRGTGLWGKTLLSGYGDKIEMVGLCDINPGRVEFAKKYIGASCPLFTDFDQMLTSVKPELIIVTTVDATHHQFIIKGLNFGAEVITEKPMTTNEMKCQAILDAVERSGHKLTVTFNYRYSPARQRMYEILRSGAIGDITSVDFHWYLDTDHGASYFRRWHGLRTQSGTLLVHKATHHFDLLNWLLESEPEEVFAYGSLEYYGKNGPFRSTHCRSCNHQKECKFYWPMDAHSKALYADHEHHDGYLRDACLFRPEIDIYDKMAAQIKYANGVQVSYSLTTYSPYEGYRLAFNGTKGRLETWIKESQPWAEEPVDELHLTSMFGQREVIKVPQHDGHGGGDKLMLDAIFRPEVTPNKNRLNASVRDGAMSALIGIAARKSIEEHQPIRIEHLTSLKPQAIRP